MLAVLGNTSFRRLFTAQVVALLGTGLLTVALGLLAFDLAGASSGAVLGTAMTIKMLAYVGAGPMLTALTARIPRKALLISADALRTGLAFALPWVDQIWQIYALIFVLQCASATFTPAFQAVIPAVLPQEREYTRALTLSRLAYDLEALVSPVLAAALLGVLSFHYLFVATAVGFVVSAVAVAFARFPELEGARPIGFRERLTQGVGVFLVAPELRALAALNLVVSGAVAMVLVNTPVLVQGELGRAQADVAVLLGAYGAGSMLVALCLPRLLDELPERRVMLAGAAAVPLVLGTAAAVIEWGGSYRWTALLFLWALLGAATSAIVTPSARLLRRNSEEANRAAVFAAQFSLSHACYLIAYPVAGWLGAGAGLEVAGAVLALVATAGAAGAARAWSARATQPELAG